MRKAWNNVWVLWEYDFLGSPLAMKREGVRDSRSVAKRKRREDHWQSRGRGIEGPDQDVTET